ncbi:MAG: NrsF family protein, partial [Bacteriovorax sp.]
MNTDDLINQMSSHLRPIKPQSSPRVFSFQFFLFSLLVIGLGLGIFHFRSDLKELLSNYLFLIELLFSLSLMVSGFLLIAWMTSPGRQYGVRYKMGTSFTFFTLLTLNCYRLSLSSIPFTKSPVLAIDLKCFVMVLAYSLIIS